MMKFFRKYNKQLLAIFMAGLMIVFIGGSALEGLLTPSSNPQVAQSNLGPIMFDDQREALQETQLLESIGQFWQRPVFSDNDPLEAMDWILLSREAQKSGVVVVPAAIETTPGFESVMDTISIVAHRLKVKPRNIIAALAKLESIRQTASAIAGTTSPSEAEIMRAGRDALERVMIRAVLLPAEAFVDAKAVISDEEATAHFAKYRERERGPGLEFGYYRPPSIKVQYVKINRDAIAANIGVPNLERKAKTFYEEQREKNLVFRRKAEELTAPDPAAQGLIVGPPAPKVTSYIDWEAAKDIAMIELRKQYADETVQRIVDWFMQSLNEPWSDAARRANGYKTTPEEVNSIDYYNTLLERLPQSLHYADAVTVHVTDFVTQEEASKLPDIGSLSARIGQGLTARSFGAVAFSNEAIVPEIPKGSDISPADFMALHQSWPQPLTDSRSGNVFIFRVVEARPGGPAESLEQVREQVAADLRLLSGYETAKKRAESLRSCCAAKEPLNEAYEADPELAAFRASGEGAKTGFFEPPPFSRVIRNLAAKGRSPEGVFVGGGLGKLPNDIVEACFELGDSHEKTAVMELPDRSAVLVVEWVETFPAGEDEFNGLRTDLISQLTDSRRRELLNDWMSPDRIRARTGLDLGRN